MNQWSDEAIQQAWESFPHFLYIVWVCIGLPQPTTVQLDMAMFIQNGKQRRHIIQAFRGIGKSFITCAYVVWRLWKNRDLRVLIVSASGDRADANARFIKKIIDIVPFLSDMKAVKGQLDTQNIFEVGGAQPDASPSVKSVGITGQITGTRADLLIPDDVEIPKNSATQLQRDKLGEAVKEFDAILKPGGEILYLGTPQCEASLYNELENRGYMTRIWPVEVPDAKLYADYGHKLAPMIQEMYQDNKIGEPTDPMRFNAVEIGERKLSYGKAGFQLQFMLNTSLSDNEKYPLRCADIIVTNLDLTQGSLTYAWSNDVPQRLTELPCTGLKGDSWFTQLHRSEEIQPYSGTVMTIDGSGRGKDETSYCISKFLAGYIFVFEVDGMFDGYSDMTMTRMAQRAKFFGVNEVVVEANFGDGMFTKLLQPVFRKIHPVSFEEVRHNQQKEARIIDTLEPVMMQHKLIFNESVIQNDYRRYQMDQQYSLVYQLTRLCRERQALAHDDRLDALAMNVAYWTAHMDVAHEEEKEQLTDEWLEEVMSGDGLLGQYRGKTKGNYAVNNIMVIRNR